LDRHQQPAPVKDVCQHAADDGEQRVREHVCGLDERDEDRGMSSADEEPLSADGRVGAPLVCSSQHEHAITTTEL